MYSLIIKKKNSAALITNIPSCAWQKDVNMRARQENQQCECFACSQQKGVNDQIPRT